jgi:myosin-5
MLEAIRIARAAYPHRLPCPAFLLLFGAMAPAHPLPADPRAAAAAAAAALLPDGGYVIGHTKVFLRPGVMPKLEARRAARRAGAATALQRAGRGVSARALLSRARRATTRLQATARRRAASRTAASRLAALLFISRCSRGRLCRRAYATLRRDRAAMAIQTARRGAAARAKYSTLRGAATTVQATVRRKSAARRVAAEVEREKVSGGRE